MTTIREFTSTHFLEKCDVLFGGTISIGTVYSWSRKITTILMDYFRTLAINIGFTMAHQNLRKLIEAFKVITGVIQVLMALVVPIKS